MPRGIKLQNVFPFPYFHPKHYFRHFQAKVA